MKTNKNYLYGILVIVILILIGYHLKQLPKETKNEQKIEENKEAWLVDNSNYLYYPLDREIVNFNRQDYNETDNLSIHKIIYQSRRGNIFGFLALPLNVTEPLPGIILLPGAGVSKESELSLAEMIAEIGAAVLVIDQRGVGETDGEFPSLDEDYASFISGKEPYQHLMVYDALRAYDLLKAAPFVDSSRIIIVGESLGGRIAVIAAAIDRNVKGVLLISSAGLNFQDKGDANKDAFIKSIDSDHYIGLITPRKLVMIHNINDNIIPIGSAVNSYSKAQEPKQLIAVNDTNCNHGYCDTMYDGLIESLDYLVDIKSKTILSVG